MTISTTNLTGFLGSDSGNLVESAGRRSPPAGAGPPTPISPFARRPFGEPLSRRERFAVLAFFAALTVLLGIALARGEARFREAHAAPQKAVSTAATARACTPAVLLC